MCCNIIKPKYAESAVKTIRTPRHGRSQSCDKTHPQQQLQTTLTLLKQMNVEKVWSVDQKEDLTFSHGQHHCSKKLNMPQKDNFVFTSYFKFFLLHVLRLASHAPSKFGKLFDLQMSSSARSSTSHNHLSSFLSRFILLIICVLSGKKFWLFTFTFYYDKVAR